MPDGARLDAIMGNAPDQVPGFSEEAVGRTFAAEQEGALAFDHSQQVWFIWDGSKWAADKTGIAFDRAREAVRRASRSSLATEKEKGAMGRIAFVRAVDGFARADQRLAVHQGMWDADPWLLGVPGGVVDLRTGKGRKALPTEWISRQCAVAPSSKPPTMWLAFLEDATRGDKETQAFLQRLAGYCLTGDVTEEMLSFLYGPGGNGKGVFVSTVTGIMAEYAIAMPMDAFTAEARMPQEYYRAQMAGARLVTASETEAGRTWAESQIKELTGNEAPVSARHPYGRPFTYRPQFKLMFVGNHAPRLKGKSQAMERRLRIVPFEHEPTKPDPTLKERLRPEWPQILRWMIDGCLAWQQQRLGTARAIAAASSAYFEQQDAFGRWLAERCSLDTTHVMQSKPGALYSDFKAWCQANGEHAPNNAEFAETMGRQKGLRRVTIKGTAWIKGIALRPEPGRDGRDE
jgi:putative DNA primase/helicase